MNLFGDWGLTFAQPWLLLLLLLVPLLAYLKGRQGKVAAVVFSSIGMLQALGKRANSKAGRLSTGLFYTALALLLAGLARPQAGRSLTHSQASGIDIIVLIDVSKSMLAEDFTIGSQRANRLETIKAVTRRFIERRPNDRIGIVAFAGKPYLVSPLTLDHDWLFENLERVKIGLVEDGTAIGSAIASGCNRLKEREAKSKVLILLTDGDNNAGKVPPETAAEAAKTLGIKLYAIGAGSRGTAPFPFRDSFGRTVYQNVNVEFNESGLRKVAEIAQGKFYRATDTRSLEGIYKEIDELEKSTVELTKYNQYKELFPWFVGAGVGLLLIEALLSLTLWRRLP